GSPKHAKKFSDLTNSKWLRVSKPFVFKGVKKVLQGKKTIVVGDKYLTDGLFALNLKADFIKVERVLSGRESLKTRITYFLDDFVWKIKPYITLVRPWQWVKNLLVLAPVFFAGKFFVYSDLYNALLAVLIFTIFSSSVYILNDILDHKEDSTHPIKKNRPVASSQISVKSAYLFGFILLIFGFTLTSFLTSVVYIIIIYLFLNMIYSLYLKRVAVIEFVVVASFYVLRIIAGGIAVPVYISPWIILCVFFGSLFVVIGKRRSEFSRSNRREVLESYSERALDLVFISSAISALVIYAIWSVLEHNSPYLVYSTVFVCIALFRLLNLIYNESSHGESPEVLVFKDRYIFLSFVSWLIYVSFVFYLSIR
ncbi:MAG: decaprenyl-phosphate phosphoribosyltransferase, partial [Minisyncoccia bacterium]